MSNVIKFDNQAQVILFECELKGQLSDGYWENARPHNHWRAPCDATAVVRGPDEVCGANFWASRKYNFAARELREVVGARMIGFVKFYTAFPTIDFDQHWDFDYEGVSAQEITTNVMKWKKESDKYWVEKAERIMKTLNCTTIDELTEEMQKVDQVQYTNAQLVKDLKEMSKIIQIKLRD